MAWPTRIGGGAPGVVDMSRLDQRLVPRTVEAGQVWLDQRAELSPPPDLLRRPVDPFGDGFGESLLHAVLVDDRDPAVFHQHTAVHYDGVDVPRIGPIDHHIQERF